MKYRKRIIKDVTGCERRQTDHASSERLTDTWAETPAETDRSPEATIYRQPLSEAVWRVTCGEDPRRNWHSRSFKRLQDVVLLLLLYSWAGRRGKAGECSVRLIHYTPGSSTKEIMDRCPHEATKWQDLMCITLTELLADKVSYIVIADTLNGKWQ